MLEEENFLDQDTFIVVTDRTKPAMKLTVDELKKRGKTVYVADVSKNPESAEITRIADIPEGIENAIIGLKETDPGYIIEPLEKKGVKKIWIHWRTDTDKVKEMCRTSDVECIIGKCPMMYLGKNFSIHGVHRSIAKLLGKY